jgi:prophage regulatory protein
VTDFRLLNLIGTYLGGHLNVTDDHTQAAADYLSAPQLEQLTGTPASTWRYWAHIGTGPASFKIGRRRVWKRSTVREWLESQEAGSL